MNGVYQTFNKRTKAWTKIRITKKGSEILDVKQTNPTVPFKGIPEL